MRARSTVTVAAAASRRSTASNDNTSPTATSAPRSAISRARLRRRPPPLPGRPPGRKGRGKFRRVTWDDALDLVADKFAGARSDARRRKRSCRSATADQRLSHAGLRRRDSVPPVRTSRLLRTCARRRPVPQTWPLRQDGVGQLRGLPRRQMIIVWGVNPGVRHPPDALSQGGATTGATRRRSIRGRPVARQADVHLPVKPGTDRRRAGHSSLSLRRGHADQAFLDEHTTGAARLRENAKPWTFERAAEVAASSRSLRHQLPSATRNVAGAGEVRLGTRTQPQRRQRRRRGAGPARGRRQVRRARRRLLDEQLRDVGHRAPWLRDQDPPTRAVNMNKVGRKLTEPRARRSKCCSSTTATRPRPCPISTA